MTIETLNANHIIVRTGNTETLFSYGTKILEKRNGKVKLGKDWAYSSTTSKHRNRFLGETTEETRTKLTNGEYTLL